MSEQMVMQVPGWARVVVLPKMHEIKPARGYLEPEDFCLWHEICEVEVPKGGDVVHHRCKDHDVVLCWEMT